MDARRPADPRPDDQPGDPIADLTAALDWWREAGVDCDFADVPRQWLVAAGDPDQANARNDPAVPADASHFPAVTARPAVPPPAPRAMIGGDRAHWPTELSAFGAWWQGEPSLDAGQSRGRIPPRGPGAASVMMLVPQPEAEDDDRLLSGPQGRLLAAMLAAMDLPADRVYFASALPRHTPMADWADLAAHGLGDVLRHHIALARPQRLIAFGRHLPPLLEAVGFAPARTGNVPPQSHPILPDISHDGASVPILVARDLGSLLERPVAKGSFWQQWLEWSAAR